MRYYLTFLTLFSLQLAQGQFSTYDYILNGMRTAGKRKVTQTLVENKVSFNYISLNKDGTLSKRAMYHIDIVNMYYEYCYYYDSIGRLDKMISMTMSKPLGAEQKSLEREFGAIEPSYDTTYYFYYPNGLLKYSIKPSSDMGKEVIKYEYNEDNLCIQEYYQLGTIAANWYVKTTYYDKNKVILINKIHADKTRDTFKTKYEYQNEKLVGIYQSTRFNQAKSTYTYDSLGYKVERLVFNNPRDTSKFTKTISYYKDEVLIKEMFYDGSELYSIDTFFYDEQGLLTLERTEMMDSPKRVYEIKYKYE
jgi:hypothetical protein